MCWAIHSQVGAFQNDRNSSCRNINTKVVDVQITTAESQNCIPSKYTYFKQIMKTIDLLVGLLHQCFKVY